MPSPVPPVAATLGYAGAIPFIAGAMAIAWGLEPSPLPALLGYGAVILSFMGGIHWGVGMAGAAPDRHRLVLSVVPALLGWLALLLEGRSGLLLLAAAFLLLVAYDLAAARKRTVPEWYPALRLPLTGIVVLSLIVGVSMAP